jgi:predicted NAD-dependent protein-ADP-ribosyltransferase YbiA (DUF1768 family)
MSNKNNTDCVEFYEADEQPYGVFSNYFNNPITIASIEYASVEHFYQSSKFHDAQYQEVIRQASTPNKAKILASQKTGGGYAWLQFTIAHRCSIFNITLLGSFHLH